MPQVSEGEMILCGSILIVMGDTDECISSWFMTQFCNLEVSDSFTVPGRVCTDAMITSTDEEWIECRHDVVFIEASSDEAPNDPNYADSSDESWLDSPLYWVAIIAAIAVIIVSLAIINSNLRERITATLGLEEE